MRKLYEISVYGCDDTTTIQCELTDKELELVEKIAIAITDTSTYQCMPTMGVELVEVDVK